MSLSHYQEHQLHRIETELLRSDPQLTAMLGIFGRLSAGEAMPAWEQVPTRQQSIRRAAALTVTAATVAADAISLLLGAVLTLVIAADLRRRHRRPTPAPERTPPQPGSRRPPRPGRPELTADPGDSRAAESLRRTDTKRTLPTAGRPAQAPRKDPALGQAAGPGSSRSH